MIEVTRLSDHIEFELIRARREPLFSRLRMFIDRLLKLRVVFISITGKDAIIVFNAGKIIVKESER